MDKAPLKGRYVYLYIDIDVEVDIDMDRYFGCSKGVFKSQFRCCLLA